MRRLRLLLYRRLVRRMHASGLKVYALLGSGYLHTERYVLPRHREEAVAMLQRVLDYNAAAAPDERFDGVNLDIEPHILAEWATRKMALLAGLVEISDALMRVKAQSSQTLPVGAAIPFWLDGIQLEWHGRVKPVSQHLQDIYDYVALMDYRDHAEGGDGLVSHAMDELRYGETIGRPVLIGIETSPNAIAKVSFHHLAEADLERELAATSRSVGGMRSFGGYVVHHYAAYRRWLGLAFSINNFTTRYIEITDQYFYNIEKQDPGQPYLAPPHEREVEGAKYLQYDAIDVNVHNDSQYRGIGVAFVLHDKVLDNFCAFVMRCDYNGNKVINMQPTSLSSAEKAFEDMSDSSGFDSNVIWNDMVVSLTIRDKQDTLCAGTFTIEEANNVT